MLNVFFLINTLKGAYFLKYFIFMFACSQKKCKKERKKENVVKQ